MSPSLSLSTSLLSFLFFLPPPSTLGKPVHYSVSVNTHKCAHTAGRLCGSGAWSGSRAVATSKCSRGRNDRALRQPGALPIANPKPRFCIFELQPPKTYAPCFSFSSIYTPTPPQHDKRRDANSSGLD